MASSDSGFDRESWTYTTCQPCKPAQIPVTVITGGFGAGKTEVIRQILGKSQLRIACLLNDVADTCYDLHKLSESGAPLVTSIQITGGCICCTRRESFVNQMTMLSKSPNIDHILVESSAVAEPLHLAENFALLTDTVRLKTLVAVIDASSTATMYASLLSLANLEEPARKKLLAGLASPNCRRNILQPPTRLLVEQIRFANFILINQCDLVPYECTADLVQVVRRLNPKAEIIPCATGNMHKILPTDIIGTTRFAMEDVENDERWFEEARSGVVLKRCMPLRDQGLVSPDRCPSIYASGQAPSPEDSLNSLPFSRFRRDGSIVQKSGGSSSW